ncbi:MAG: HAD family hydrolase [Leptolyngbya sp. SIO4C1]|nr:HAD family hydrolase [Leptolyngbya sp. SIO4C1]
MDGTLTVSIHDFQAIKAELGLPLDQPILEALAAVPEPEASQLHQQLEAIELEIAQAATQQAGAYDLLSALKAQGHQVGVLTRNSKPNAIATLAACDLAQFFQPDFILSRHCCTPKPSPEGILKLLSAWQAQPHEAVMVGDYVFDLAAGRSAGTATVYIDPSGQFEWQAQADRQVMTLGEVVELLAAA